MWDDYIRIANGELEIVFRDDVVETDWDKCETYIFLRKNSIVIDLDEGRADEYPKGKTIINRFPKSVAERIKKKYSYCDF